ncbi:MAG: VWA domain-containing protein [Candidatus Eremiobacteraeota bacterium]|nr:VWA domain-containing protein [Candidatus Eremiobacteraeota bacterium]MCW5871788.1 VWA domain-containing protein [Candidatus Eremiobacteraeota bacterium]
MTPRIQLLALQPAVCQDSSTTVQLLVRLRAPKPEMDGRPPLNVGLSIDRSGSMNGLPLERAKEAAAHLVQQLQETDCVSVVAFDSLVEVLAPFQRARARQSILSSLSALCARGGTNLFQGWQDSCRQVAEGLQGRRLNRVILLSDGGANEGVVHPLRIAEEVARWQSRGITTTTIGLGQGYNEDLLSAMAKAGSGSFYHVQTPADIESAFQVEMLGLSATFGQAVSLGITPEEGVEVTRVYNVLDETERGRLKVADLVHGCPVEVVIELQVAPQSEERDLCRFRLAWNEVETQNRQSTEVRLRLPVVPRGQLSEFPLNLEVAQKRALKLSARLLGEAIGKIDQKERAVARQALQAALDVLGEAPACAEIEQSRQQLQSLLQQLENGDFSGARKFATFASSSVSLGSIVMHGWVKAFMALPPDQRTPEKAEELRKASGWM